jgi:hypothetical protein
MDLDVSETGKMKISKIEVYQVDLPLASILKRCLLFQQD